MMDRLLENDTVLKILSLLAAIFLWIEVTSVSAHPAHHSPQKERALAPVAVEWIPPRASSLNVTTPNPNAVVVFISGTPSALAAAKPSKVTASVDLSRFNRPGKYDVPVQAFPPRNTHVVNVTPPQVEVTIEQVGRRRFPVRVAVEGTPPHGYLVTKLQPDVSSATVSGPMSALDQIAALTASVPVTGHTGDFEDQSVLEPVNAKGAVVPHVEVNPPMVSVSAHISQKPPETTVGVVVRVSGHPGRGYKIQSIAVRPEQVTITGPRRQIGRISNVYTAPINIGGSTGPVTGSVPVHLPAGVSMIGGQNLVQVTIEVVSTHGA